MLSKWRFYFSEYRMVLLILVPVVKQRCCHFDDILVTSCQNDTFWCSQQHRCCQNGISTSVSISGEYRISDIFCINSITFQSSFNSSPLGQNGRHFADDIFNYIFLNENFCILLPTSLKFVPKGPIDKKSALVKVMAWRRTGDKPLAETMLSQFTDTYMQH